jgi:hypothetical protein
MRPIALAATTLAALVGVQPASANPYASCFHVLVPARVSPGCFVLVPLGPDGRVDPRTGLRSVFGMTRHRDNARVTVALGEQCQGGIRAPRAGRNRVTLPVRDISCIGNTLVVTEFNGTERRFTQRRR